MPILDTVLNWTPISRIRRNHALEHATLQILARHVANLAAAGYSDTNGFWIIGQVPTEALEQAVTEAVARLRAGEFNLAIHPNCGTNFVAAGAIAGALSWLAMVFNPGGIRRNLQRLPMLISLSTIGIILAQPVGPFLQAKFTVNPAIGALKVTEIARVQRTDGIVHRVRTAN